MDSESLVLAVDVGTTNIKAGLVDGTGRMVKLVQRELAIERDQSGRAEHDPETLFDEFVSVCREVSHGCGDRVAALVTSTYQLGLLPVDAEGRPLMGMMTLLDTRPQESFPELQESVDPAALYRHTGCPPLFQYPFSKIHWLKTRHPDVFSAARHFLGSKDYLMLRLLGEYYTEASLATSTSLMNIRTLQWDEMPLGVLGLNPDELPATVPSEKALCELPRAACDLLGLPSGVRFVPGVYDGGAVGIGLGCMGEGVGVINLGTTAMLRVPDRRPVLDADPLMRLQTYYLADDKWFPGGGINNAGVVLKWLRDNVFGLSYDELVDEARSVSDTAGLFFLPFLSGERNPQIGNAASGVFFGLRQHHGKGHMVLAALEGISYMLRMVMEALQENGLSPKCIRVGGGGARSDLWMGILASILGVPLQVTCVHEPALVGSAILGFTALGRYADHDEATDAMVNLGETFEPDAESEARYGKDYEFYKYLVGNIGEAFRRHSGRGA